ncbi:MAG: superoxide dismutase [Bacteroidales bacterium]|nr:superoxide dismutase [Bacteroidales bacterium]
MEQIIALPYAPTALEPVISAATLGFHHGKHLQAYVNNLNAALPGSPYEGLPLEEIVRRADGAVFNNAGQILNHNLYFTQFRAPREGNAPAGALKERIDSQFGSFDSFQAEFVAKGAGLFGSGWVWLSAGDDGVLFITQEPNAGNPVTKGLQPLLTFDVWEHAYYLDYQNRRPDHLKSLWSIIDWDEVGRRYGR